MRNVFFLIVIVAFLVMLLPVLAAAGEKFRDRYRAVFFGGHEKEAVEELRRKDG